jgi:hypothetical protein
MIAAALKISGGLRFAQPTQRPFHVSSGAQKEHERLLRKTISPKVDDLKTISPPSNPSPSWFCSY